MHYGTPGQPVQVSAAGGTDLRWGTYRVPASPCTYVPMYLPRQQKSMCTLLIRLWLLYKLRHYISTTYICKYVGREGQCSAQRGKKEKRKKNAKPSIA